MKKETSDNILQNKMDKLNEVNAMPARNFEPVWERLENKLHPQNKRRAHYFYFAAASLLLAIFSGLVIQYQLKDKPPTQVANERLSIKHTQQVVPPDMVAKSSTQPAKNNVSHLILNNNIGKKKNTIPMSNHKKAAVSIQHENGIGSIARAAEALPDFKPAEAPTTIINVDNSLTVVSRKKNTLKTLHINEIDNGTDSKASQILKEPNVNWLFTTNNIDLNNREANKNYQPIVHKKSFFSIPIQRQNSN